MNNTVAPLVVHDPWRFYCGDTWRIPFTCVDPTGAPLDLTGFTGDQVEWKLDTYDPANVFTKDLDDGIDVVDATAGTVLVTITSDESAALPPDYYRDQLWTTLDDGSIMTQSSGRIEAVQSLV
jgi:hypothetical protein